MKLVIEESMSDHYLNLTKYIINDVYELIADHE